MPIRNDGIQHTQIRTCARPIISRLGTNKMVDPLDRRTRQKGVPRPGGSVPRNQFLYVKAANMRSFDKDSPGLFFLGRVKTNIFKSVFNLHSSSDTNIDSARRIRFNHFSGQKLGSSDGNINHQKSHPFLLSSGNHSNRKRKTGLG